MPPPLDLFSEEATESEPCADGHLDWGAYRQKKKPLEHKLNLKSWLQGEVTAGLQSFNRKDEKRNRVLMKDPAASKRN